MYISSLHDKDKVFQDIANIWEVLEILLFSLKKNKNHVFCCCSCCGCSVITSNEFGGCNQKICAYYCISLKKDLQKSSALALFCLLTLTL